MSGSSVTTRGRKKRAPANSSTQNILDQSVRDVLCQYHSWFSLGLLEVSFIHRLGNILMSIQGNLELGREEVNQGRSAEKYFKDIELAVHTASEYASWIQQSQMKEPVNLRRVDLSQCCREAIECLDQRWNRKTKIQVKAPSQQVQAQTDPLLLIVMLLELLSVPEVVSANEAADGRSLSISLSLPNSNHAPTQRTASNIELRIDAARMKPWSGGGAVDSSEKEPAQKNHVSYEMARSVMKLFKGDICISHPQQLDESVSLYFPMKL